MKLGNSLRFLYPTGPQSHALFKQLLASAPVGSFIERPMGATDTAEQARNVLEVAAAARAAGLDSLLYGDNHAVPAAFANCFSAIPTVGRLGAVTGGMTLGMVLLAPFYHPVLLAEQLGTLAAFASAPLVVTLANGGSAQAFQAFGLPMSSRASRLEELVAVLRPLLAGERVSFRGKHFSVDGVSISPLPRVPVELWIAGTVPAAVARAGRIGDGWLSGQNATREQLVTQLEVYRDAAARAGRVAQPVLRRDIYVGESDAEAEAVVGRILAEGYRGTGMDQLLVGSAATVVEKLRDYRKLGFDYAMVRHIVGDHDLMLRSFERIGKEVIPAIRGL
jgi:alkanesulfonate monooxygenase SsuD/methylene tetrahydromethanopterin reductase-like flavin-dependent oxidoreductase (luciferase family)